jgi:hypothetical protein
MAFAENQGKIEGELAGGAAGVTSLPGCPFKNFLKK